MLVPEAFDGYDKKKDIGAPGFIANVILKILSQMINR